jgi:hypothetical protein
MCIRLPTSRAGYLAQALEQRLADLGYVQGRLLHRFAGAQPDKVEEAIVSLLPQIDLLVVRGTMGGMAAKKVVRGVPIVFVSVAAPRIWGWSEASRILAAT